MKTRGRRVLLLIGLVASLFMFLLVGLPELWVYAEARQFRSGSRPAVRSVLRAYLRSKVTADYWENEMLRQGRVIASQPLADRLDFYRALVVYCDLDASRAFLFVEMVGGDANALSDNLRELRGRSEFSTLSQNAQENVEGWMVEMETISRENLKP